MAGLVPAICLRPRPIDDAAKCAALDQFRLQPRCGFAATEEGNTIAKLPMIVEVAKTWDGCTTGT
jgi:hypothetical protein